MRKRNDLGRHPLPRFQSGVTDDGRRWLKIRVDWDPQRLGGNARKRLGFTHRGVATRLTRLAREAARSAYIFSGEPVLGVPVQVTVHVYRIRAMDDDNVFTGLKEVRDVLFTHNDRTTGSVTTGITPNDGPEFIPDGVRLVWHTGNEFTKLDCPPCVLWEVRTIGGA